VCERCVCVCVCVRERERDTREVFRAKLSPDLSSSPLSSSDLSSWCTVYGSCFRVGLGFMVGEGVRVGLGFRVGLGVGEDGDAPLRNWSPSSPRKWDP